MKGFRTWFVLVVSITALAQQPLGLPAKDENVMVAVVSRDGSMLSGGIGTGKRTRNGTIDVELLGWLSKTGEWKSHPCAKDYSKRCVKFAHGYLAKSHTYIVVSAEGKGATIHSAPVTLSECFDYTGTGTYSGAPIATSAVAAGSADFFADSSPALLLNNESSAPTRKALGRLVPKELDSIERLRIFSVRLEGRNLTVVQRNYSDFADRAEHRYAYLFAIGTLSQGSFHILHMKQNTEDEEESLLGTVSLKNGREFLITAVSDPESHSFRIYGIQSGKLTMVYSGGGSSC
jgi:hypothetical protein